jgi:HD superfamily phosphohydrolase
MDKALLIKTNIIKQLLVKLESDKSGSAEALSSTKSLASSKEFIAESKWDTRGIEAGYLAGAQEKRIKELEIEITALKFLDKNLRIINEVEIGALVWTDDKNYFITSGTGGIDVDTSDGVFKVISRKSPLFKKLFDEEIEIVKIN